MKLPTLLFCLFSIYLCQAQEASALHLRSWKNPDKQYIIPAKMDLQLDIDTSNLLDPDKLMHHTYYGKISSKQGNNVVMVVYSEDQEFKLKNGILKEISISYSNEDYSKRSNPQELKEINMDRISSVSYSQQKPLSTGGYLLAGMSVFTAMIIAPIVSINDKGDFVQQRYYRILAGCATGFVIGIPLGAIFQKNRTYNISKIKPTNAEQDLYYFDEH